MTTHMIDSAVFGAAWASPALRAIFSERARLDGWLEILATLAESQAEIGLVPPSAAAEIRRVCERGEIDLDTLAEHYRQTGHSLHGLLSVLGQQATDGAGEWICFGATVQDITDTWMSRALLRTWRIVFDEMREIEASLLTLASAHRTTPMIGRTHGQAGAPISFGLKVAVWAREMRRHIERLKEVRARIGHGQLVGAVGSMAAFGPRALTLRARFCRRLGLSEETLPWTSARDGSTELVGLLALIATTFDKIGHEVYNLARSEIGELRERIKDKAVGSITMPHKRNPEAAEHLGTLARMIRHQSACLLEGMVHEHERDGRSWKAEWSLIPPTCLMTGALLHLARELCASLEVDDARMLANLQGTQGFVCSETVMSGLGERLGNRTAHRLVLEISRVAQNRGGNLEEALRDALAREPDLAQHISEAELTALFDIRRQLGQCPQMVDQALAQAREARSADLSFLSA